MPAKKKPNTKGIKIVSSTTAKKRLLLTVAVFAVIGVIFLIRSFAATTVYSVNIQDIIGSSNPNWTVEGAKVVEIPDGKKTAKVVRLTSPSVLRYSFTMNPGYYKACYNLKPITSDADADIALGVVGQPGLTGSKLTIANGSIALNKYNEHCVSVYESGSGTSSKRFVAGVSTTKGTWEVLSFSIRVDEDYASYSSYGSYGGSTPIDESVNNVKLTVTASAPYTITSTSASTNVGLNLPSPTEITGQNNPITTYGIQFGLTTNYGSSYDYVNDRPTAAFGFGPTISGLKCNTTYHYRGYGANKYGMSYSPDVTFKTKGCPS